MMKVSLALAGLLLVSSTEAFAVDEAPSSSLGVASVIVARAANECFSTVVRATGYVVPRATAVVMFNAPGFRVSEVSAHEGDIVKSGDQVAVVVLAPGSAVAPDHRPAGPSQMALKAPVSGTILRSDINVGMPTSAKADPLFLLAVDGEMEALIDIPSVHVLELSAGQTARVSLDDGREFAAHVRVVPLEINRVSQIGQARLSIDSEKPLKMGLFVHAAIDASRSCGIGVPRAALLHESDATRVQIVKDKTITTRVVKVGLLSDQDAEIKEGVADGDLVVANAGTSLRDGDRVKPILQDLQEVQ